MTIELLATTLKFFAICVLVSLASSSLTISASSDEKAQSPLLTVERIFGDSEFAAKNYEVRWQADGSYLRLEAVDEPADGDEEQKDNRVQKLVRHDVESGKATVMVDTSSLVPEGVEKPLHIDDYELAANQSRLLIYTNSQRVWRTNSRGDYWVYEFASGRLDRLGKRFPAASLMFAKFSPDGRSAAYVSGNEIYVEELFSDQATQLTRRTSDHVIHGVFDWVYEEEFQIQDGFQWSPDGKRIAYWQLDTSEVPVFSLTNQTSSSYPTVQNIPWPRAGQKNSAGRIGVVNVANRQVRMMALPGDPRESYVPRIHWANNSRELAVQQLNRYQNEIAVWLAEVDTGNARRVFTDTDSTWVDVDDDFHWSSDGRSFTWSSERDGWRRMYRVPLSSGEPTMLTGSGMDVIQFLGTDETSKTTYFLASPDNATACYLYHQQPGSAPTRLTPSDQSGWHAYDLSTNFQYAIHRWARFGQPKITQLIRLADHSVVRELENNSALVNKLKTLDLGKTEFLQVDVGGDTIGSSTDLASGNSPDVVLDGWRILPPNFDPAKKYPLLIYVYSEPAGQTVTDRWGGNGYLWHQMLAQQGYIVMSFDSRGTPAPRGRDWRKSIHRKIGTIAISDQAEAVRKTIQRDAFIDADRVGIWGWSGGGTSALHAVFQHPDVYRMAIAVAAVPDLRNYDTIYEERYMGTPQDNPEGYKSGSPITWANQLEGKLLLIHGTGDDNCHYQTTELLIDELVRNGKQFSLMAYPDRTHSIGEGEGTAMHLRNLMTDFIQSNL